MKEQSKSNKVWPRSTPAPKRHWRASRHLPSSWTSYCKTSPTRRCQILKI